MSERQTFFICLVFLFLGITLGVLIYILIDMRTVYSINISDWGCKEKIINNDKVECNIYERKVKLIEKR